LTLQWQNSPNSKCIPTRIPGSKTTHNSNYSLLNSKNLYAVGGIEVYQIPGTHALPTFRWLISDRRESSICHIGCIDY
jgi:hypothetical protein